MSRKLAGLNGHSSVAPLEEPNSDGPYDAGHTFEALTSVALLADTFESHVLESRCSAEHRSVLEAASKALTAMWNVYEIIGALDAEGEPQEDGDAEWDDWFAAPLPAEEDGE